MYKVKFLQSIETVGMNAVKRFHSVVYSDGTIAKRAAMFKSMGFKGIDSVELLPASKKRSAGKLSVKEVLDLFYPEETIAAGIKIVISPEDKAIKDAALKNSGKQKDEKPADGIGDPPPEIMPEELEALREEAKGLGVKNVHNMKEPKLLQKIAEAKQN